MKVKFINRRNPINPSEEQKYYAQAVNQGVAELADLSLQITKYSSLSQGDVMKNPKDYSYNLIDRVKVGFTPSVKFKKELENITYER